MDTFSLNGRLHFSTVCPECGQPWLVRKDHYESDRSTNCGCVRNKYGQMSNWLEYGVWRAMKRRCYLVTDKRYERYGGRGIKVCSQWKDDYAKFIEDMGRRPSDLHTIDRIDNDGDYSPDNCRWALMKSQQMNRSNSVIKEDMVDPILERIRCGESLRSISNNLLINYKTIISFKFRHKHLL